MTIRYYVSVEDSSGSVVDIINQPLSIAYDLGLSRRNVLTLQLSGYERYTLPQDSVLGLYRRDSRISPDFVNVANFIFKTEVKALAESGLKTRTIYGASPEELIQKAVIAYPAGSAQTRKNGDVAQVLASFVNENSGSLALTSNGRYVDHITPLTVPTPSAVGLNWQGSRSGKSLMDVCQDIVSYARENGLRLDFRVTYSAGAYTLQVGILGTDRTATAVNPATGLNGAGYRPIVISPLLENMRSYQDSLARMNEANVIIALGAGEQEDRQTAVAVNVASQSATSLAHREAIVNATNETASGLTAKATAELDMMVGKRNFSAQPDYTKVRLFTDYSVGDFVTFETEDGERFNRQIMTGSVSVDLTGNDVVEKYSLEFDAL
ncbi:MAG: hypothetical protein KDD89_00110 [Anaerolineales bacterium]|nr:hypothetical protein [Anaerolineales bacterium]